MTTWVLMKIVLLKVSSDWIFDFYTGISYIPKWISSVKWNQGCSGAGSFGSSPQRGLIPPHTWLIYGKRLESDLCCLRSFPEPRVTSNKQIKTRTVIWGRWKAEGLNRRTPPPPPTSQCVSLPVNFSFPPHVVGPFPASACSLSNPNFIHICSR